MGYRVNRFRLEAAHLPGERKLLLLILVITQFLVGGVAMSGEEEPTVVQFPDDRLLGYMVEYDAGDLNVASARKLAFEKKNAGQAVHLRGRVTLTPGRRVYLAYYDVHSLDRDRPTNLSYLDQFRTDDLDMMDVLAGEITLRESRRLSRHETLRLLWLSEAELAGGVLEVIGKLSNLEDLRLDATNVTDEQLTSLRDLKRLKRLNLYMTDVTDKGLESLARLKSLDKLELTKTFVTPAGIAWLKERLPETEIVYRGPREPEQPPPPPPTPIEPPAAPAEGEE